MHSPESVPAGGRRRIILVVLGVSAFLAIAEGVQVQVVGRLVGSRISPIWMDLFSTSVAWFSMAALVPAVIWLARRFPLDAERRFRSWLALLLGGLLFPIVHLGLVALIEFPVRVRVWPDAKLLTVFERLVGTFYVMELTSYVAILGSYMVWSTLRRLRDRELATTQLQLRATALEAGLTEARLAALSAQLNPHFLFNTLNAITALARNRQARGVVHVTTRLGSLLRHSLDQRSHWSRVREEIGFARQYLAIERVRFRKRLRVHWRVQRSCAQAVVPSMVLQPLIENALKHGISRLPEGGLVSIRIHCDGERLHIRSTNPVPPAPAHSGREGVGLENLRSRLDHLYGTDYALTLAHETAGTFTAALDLPLRFEPLESQPVGEWPRDIPRSSLTGREP